MKILSPITLYNCLCIRNISHHIKILSHFILCFFYPYLHCSFWPQVSNNDVEISILPYIALFTCVYVNNAMQGRIEKFYPTLRCIISIPTCIAISDMKISIPPYIANLHMYLSLPYQILSHLT